MLTSSDFAPNYRRHLAACLRSWARFSEDEGLLSRLEDVRLPAAVPRDVREPLEFEKWVQIREFIDGSNLKPAKRAVCAIIAVRGIRCGDVLRLKKKDLSDAVNSGTLAFEAKGERWLRYNARPFVEYLDELLSQRWKDTKRVRNLVCPNSREDKCQDTAGREIRRAFDSIAVQIGMDPGDLFAHRFRHTYSTYFLHQMVGDPEAVFKLQEQMGWARLDTAANYLRRSRREELDAVESVLLSRRNSNGQV